MSIDIGRAVRLKNPLNVAFKNDEARGHYTFKLPKGRYLVVLVLGMETDKNFGQLNVNKRLEEWGWQHEEADNAD